MSVSPFRFPILVSVFRFKISVSAFRFKNFNSVNTLSLKVSEYDYMFKIVGFT